MKRKTGKLRTNILGYFILLTVIIISCVWIFQMIFLEGYYQNKKIEKMKSFGNQLSAEQDFSSTDFMKAVNSAGNESINVYVTDDKGTIAYPEVINLPESSAEKISEAVNSFLSSEKVEYYEIKTMSEDDISFVYVTRIGDDYLVLTSSRKEIADTLRIIIVQLAAISAIVIIVGIILAWYISQKISKPIGEISRTAAKWAGGDNGVTFTTSSRYKELRELTDALNFAKDGVSKSETLLRDLLANVSHDLKTPLTMIKAYAEMINDISGNNKEKREKHTKVIIDEADRLTMLVNDILDLSKLQSDVDALNEEEVNLSELTENVIDRFAPYVENQGYTIENHVAPDLLTVVDRKKIERVLYNLLSNSINYTGEDKIVKVFLTAEGDKILLEIIDSGKGIDEENIDTIWERYYRFSETNTRPVKGTGLGLSIVRAILESHKLKYGIRSKKGCGSNFYVEFDRVRNE